uniref:Uncharacterized protein n=1 Tax=Arundo donax TaxID=35708 RepID=A0A0A9FZA5_ARUDO
MRIFAGSSSSYSIFFLIFKPDYKVSPSIQQQGSRTIRGTMAQQFVNLDATQTQANTPQQYKFYDQVTCLRCKCYENISSS